MTDKPNRYAFVARPVSGFHVPSGVGIEDVDTETRTARVLYVERDCKPVEVRCHGLATLSRPLTWAEVRHFDVYPVAD